MPTVGASLVLLLILAAFVASNEPRLLALAAEPAAPSPASTLTGIKDAAAIAQSAATILAIVAGAVWFYLRRARYPRANVRHVVTHRHLGNGFVWINVRAEIENKGDVVIHLDRARTWVARVLPVHPTIGGTLSRHVDPVPEGRTSVPWPTQGDRPVAGLGREIEPGEIRSLDWDFFVDETVETVKIYTHLTKQVKDERHFGWAVRSVHDLTAEPAAVRTPSPVTEKRP